MQSVLLIDLTMFYLRTLIFLLCCQPVSHQNVPQYTKKEKAHVILWWHETNSPIMVQRNFRREFRGNNGKAIAPDRKTIEQWYSTFKETGDSEQHRGGYRGAEVVNEVFFLYM